MKRFAIYPICVVLFLALALAADAVKRFDIERYRVILDRKPFGLEQALVTDTATTAPPAAAVAAVNALKMSAIVKDSNDRIVVGIMDTQSNKSYMIIVGETEDGIEVIKADYIAERAQIRKDGIERWISMAGDNAPAVSAAAPSPAPATASAFLPRYSLHSARGGAGGGPSLSREQYMKELRENRRPGPIPPNTSDEPRITPQMLSSVGLDYEKYMQNYNMDLIRAGGEMGPALPIELTPEQDAQLVKEGVLPPQE